MAHYRFRKTERLVSSKAIGELFSSGSRSFSSFPVKAVFRETEQGEGKDCVKVLVSVSKRHFKHAVDRNRAKRQIREAYRMHKETLSVPLQESGKRLSLAFIWMADEPQETARVERGVERLLQLIAERICRS